MRISDWSSDVCSSDLIKFNPYEYKKMNGRKRVPGESQSKRHLKLLEWIKFCKETSPTQYGDFYRAIYLYNDNWDGIGVQHRQSKERRVGKGCLSRCKYQWST